MFCTGLRLVEVDRPRTASSLMPDMTLMNSSGPVNLPPVFLIVDHCAVV
jgi:hypothetical protein